MPDLITLAEARAHLRIDDVDSDGGPDDPWLAVMIPAVSDAVLLWLKDPWRAYVLELDSDGQPILDSDGEPLPVLDSDGMEIVRPAVRAACLIELASLYRYREGEGKDNVVPGDAGHGYVLNKTSTALLTPLRRPTAA